MALNQTMEMLQTKLFDFRWGLSNECIHTVLRSDSFDLTKLFAQFAYNKLYTNRVMLGYWVVPKNMLIECIYSDCNMNVYKVD